MCNPDQSGGWRELADFCSSCNTMRLKDAVTEKDADHDGENSPLNAGALAWRTCMLSADRTANDRRDLGRE
jgi:hypothetical protein